MEHSGRALAPHTCCPLEAGTGAEMTQGLGNERWKKGRREEKRGGKSQSCTLSLYAGRSGTQRRGAEAGGLLGVLSHLELCSELRGNQRYVTKARLKHRLYFSYGTLLEPMYIEKQARQSFNVQDA